MKEKPILFTAEMVRALLAGGKTQTRRLVKVPYLNSRLDTEIRNGSITWTDHQDIEHKVDCPYGKVGDRLWVRETFFDARPFRHEPLFAAVESGIIYMADYEYRERRDKKGSVISGHSWKPSIFMPRKASRITLEITAARVERLNEISAEDVRNEGVILAGTKFDSPHIKYEEEHQRVARLAFMELWESIHGPGSWALNPYVWVIEFKKI